ESAREARQAAVQPAGLRPPRPWWWLVQETSGSTVPGNFHLGLGLQAGAVAVDCGCGEPPVVLPIGHAAVVGHGIAVDLNAIPAFRVADIGNRHVEVSTPEERHGFEPLARAKDVARR